MREFDPCLRVESFAGDINYITLSLPHGQGLSGRERQFIATIESFCRDKFGLDLCITLMKRSLTVEETVEEDVPRDIREPKRKQVSANRPSSG